MGTWNFVISIMIHVHVTIQKDCNFQYIHNCESIIISIHLIDPYNML